MYWEKDQSGMFPTLNYGQYITRPRFEEVLRCLQLPDSDDKDEQVLNYLEAVNLQFADAFNPGDTICLDESIVKSFHHDLKEKIKIIQEPRPIGNEFKNASDGRTNFVTTLALYEGQELMAEKEYVDEYGATTAAMLRLSLFRPAPLRLQGNHVKLKTMGLFKEHKLLKLT